MISDTNQNLSNKQIAQAYVHLKVYEKMKNTESVKRALKSKKMATGGEVGNEIKETKETNWVYSIGGL